IRKCVYTFLYVKYGLLWLYATADLMLNTANGGASPGVWGHNPSAIRLILTESVNSTLICGFISHDFVVIFESHYKAF
ncbi:hypothetical protein, partial [Candidatus Methanoperedens nitratireducens]|uniref:hypothetical protein n=1 Tax=Candidatus Methanoperedens nitratireducens TaxID=1392998 RepID=UPI001C544B07